LTSEQLDLRQLLEEVKRLKMEKDILKKATVFFAKEMK
jgi:transposase